MTSKDANMLSRAFDLAFDACANISEEGLCEDCPLLNHMCLEEESVIEVAQHLTPRAWKEFLDISDDIIRVHEAMEREQEEREKELKALNREYERGAR